MSTTIDQKAYLQKYLGRPSKDKKKKKKKVIKGKGIKIIDDDLDLSKLRALEGDELDILDEGEDAPQIAGIIDERPEELKKIEQFQSSSKWRVINQDDGFNSKLQIQEIKQDMKETTKENEIIFGKMYSDSEDEVQKNDSDISPPRQKSTKPRDNDSDVSPLRKRDRSPKKESRKDRHVSTKDKRDSTKDKGDSAKEKHDSDPSPPRPHESREKRRRKPSRWGQEDSRKSPDSDISPPRRSKNSPPKSYNKSKHDRSSSDQSPPRKSTKMSSKKSPERNKRKQYDSDVSPPRKERNNRDSEKNTNILSKDRRKYSPNTKKFDRKSQRDDKRDRDIYHKRKYDNSEGSQKRDKNRPRNDSDSDLSPPRNKQNKRYNEYENKDNRQEKRNNNSDSDLSPPRKDRKRNNSDSDLSPPRRERNRPSERDSKYTRNDDSPPPSNKKMARTLEGKLAGLQDARQLREENNQFRRKEEEVFKRMADDVSGRNAQVVSRRSKRETSEDRQKKIQKAERQKEIDEKYKKWSKGLKQIEAQQERIQDYLHEANKPLARHKDDRDLEDRLKQVERAGDPMLQFIKEKKRERGELPPEKPSYKGNFPPNRFNIRPGYRWDGVDRSNGYEKKYFDQKSKRKAQEEEAYKWSTEDL